MQHGKDWNGLILHLYRQIDSSIFSANTLRVVQRSTNKTYTVFGNFDRLCFTPVSSFVDYLKRSESAYQWIGGRKDIMMYPILDSDNSSAGRHFTFVPHQNDSSFDLRFLGGCKRRFLILSMLYLSDKAKSRVKSYETILIKCKRQIQRIVNKYNELICNDDETEIFFDMFGTFDAAEIGILWGADQFTDVQFLVDQIRFMSLNVADTIEPLFTTSYSIVSCYDHLSVVSSIQQLKGTAFIQLATGVSRDPVVVPSKSSVTAYLSDIQEEIKKEAPETYITINACAGEYDYIVQTRPPHLSLLTKLSDGNYGPLHSKNPISAQLFSNSTTRLAYSEEDLLEYAKNFAWEDLLQIRIPADYTEMVTSADWEGKRHLCADKESYKRFITLLKNSVTNVSSLSTNVELLYGDFIRATNATPDRQWAYDLEVQVDTAFEVLAQFRSHSDSAKLLINREYIERSEELLQRLRQQIHHVTEAGKLSLDEPDLHIAASVEYDLLFHMYYGIVKEILDCMYDRIDGPTQSSQSRLVPLIQFELTPIIKSILYYDVPTIKSRILDISIPYDAWGEPNTYIAYLVHELFHYAAPFNRDLRNDIFAKFIITEVIVNAFQCMVQNMAYAYRDDISNAETDSHIAQADDNGTVYQARELLLTNVENALVFVSNMLREKLFEFICNEDIGTLFAEDAVSNDEEDIEYLDHLRQIASGDANWNVYKDVLLSWCAGENAYDSEKRCTLAGLVREALKNASDCFDTQFSLVKYEVVHQGFAACENSYEACKDFIYSILVYDCLGTNDKEPILDLYEFVQENIKTWAPNIISQLRELLPDQAMVQLAGLGISEYLLTFALSQEKLFNPPIALLKDNSLPIRVGYIIDHLLNLKQADYKQRLEVFSQYRSDFVDLFTSYVRLCNWADTTEGTAFSTAEGKANQWFEYFLSLLSSYYSQYGCYGVVLEFLSQELYMPLLRPKRELRIRNSTRLFYDALRSGNAKDLFEANLKTVWSFQHQKFLDELIVKTEPDLTGENRHFFLHESTTKLRCVQRHYHSVCRPILKTDDLYGTFDSILRDLSDAHLSAFGTKIQQNGLWYRGSQNASFDILPSAMVHFLDSSLLAVTGSVKGTNSHGSLWKYQKSLLDEFKYQADGASEFINSASFTTPDYIALMQHYQQYTCYLDWSEDAFSSLFFALEKYIMEEPIDYRYADAALYIMDPMLYNRARKMIISRLYHGTWADDPHAKWLYQQNQKLCDEVDGYIPNLSTKENLDQFPMFTLDFRRNFPPETTGKMFHEVANKPENATLNDVIEELMNLPLAVHTSRLNPRIRKQSGQFVAYSPFALPVYKLGGDDVDDPQNRKDIRARRFAYLSLLHIQEYFLRNFQDEKPFMYELRIRAGSKADIASYLRSTGISRYRIYPELTCLKLL